MVMMDFTRDAEKHGSGIGCSAYRTTVFLLCIAALLYCAESTTHMYLPLAREYCNDPEVTSCSVLTLAGSAFSPAGHSPPHLLAATGNTGLSWPPQYITKLATRGKTTT